MGEAKQEEVKAEDKPEEKKEEKKEEAKPEEKKEEKKEEVKQEEEKKEDESKPSPPPPIVLFVDLHCVGCSKKIERSILKCRGVESVEIDMVQNQVTVKGIVDPQALCVRITKKTLRNARVLSPPPPADGDPTKSEVVSSQVSGLTTVELHVNMHCEACAQQLRRKILKMRGVQTVETELKSGKVTVTGTMNADRLVEYVYRRTRKLARLIVPQPPPPPEEEPKKEEEGEEKASEEKSPEVAKKEEEEEKATEQQDGNGGGGGKEEKKPAEEGGGGAEEQKKESDGNAAAAVVDYNIMGGDDDMSKKTMYWAPVYVIERLPPPQLFSDENPNACCIS